MRGAAGETFAGVDELLPDAGGLEAVRLLGVQPLVAGADLGEAFQVGLERGQQFVGGAGVADGVGELRAEVVDELQRVGDAVLVLEDQYFAGDGGRHVGVAVAVAADPRAEGERAGTGGQFDADALQLGREVLEYVPDGIGVQFVEVVDGVAGLVGRLGAHDAEFVGLPDEVDVLGEAQVLAAPVGVDDRRIQQFGDAAELVEHGTPGGLGGMRGEDGPYVEVLDGLAQVGRIRVLQPVGGAGEEPALGGAAVTHLVGAVDLFGDVGEVEVRGEGAHELCGGLQVRVTQEFGGGLTVGAGQGADALDEVEEFLALLAYQGLAQQIAEAADVGAQLGAGGGGLVGTAHSVRLLAVNEEVCREATPNKGGGGRRAGTRSSGAAAGSGADATPGKQSADRAVRPPQDRCPHSGHCSAPIGFPFVDGPTRSRAAGRRAAILT